jgi:hypothetical protein
MFVKSILEMYNFEDGEWDEGVVLTGILGK